MIAVISTSSPLASLALFDDRHELIAEDHREAPHAASRATIEMLRELLANQGAKLQQLTGFVADVGPGSFTGTRVGVTLVKSLAYALGSRCAGVLSFQLFEGRSAIPYRKGSYFVRDADGGIRTVEDPTGLPGYGEGFSCQTYPLASKAGKVLREVAWLSAERLLPAYCAEPSISTPKRAFEAT